MTAHNFKDLTGMVFERLTVISRDENNSHGEAMWICQCNCENKTISVVRSGDLNSGGTKSCGCLRDEILYLTNKKYNNYNLNEPYGIGYTFKNEEFYFDLSDYDLIKNYCWCINACGYLVAQDSIKNKKIYMHRLILNFPTEKTDIDHKNRNKTDNRKENLNTASHSQNIANVKIKSNNTSGIIGVEKTASSTWNARIRFETVKLTKKFKTKEEAILQRLQWEFLYFGPEFSPQRHLFEKYGIA